MNDPITACKALFYAKHCLGKTNFDSIEINEGIDILVSCIFMAQTYVTLQAD